MSSHNDKHQETSNNTAGIAVSTASHQAVGSDAPGETALLSVPPGQPLQPLGRGAAPGGVRGDTYGMEPWYVVFKVTIGCYDIC